MNVVLGVSTIWKFEDKSGVYKWEERMCLRQEGGGGGVHWAPISQISRINSFLISD